MIYEINVDHSGSYFYTSRAKLHKAEKYLKTRDIEFETYIHEKNYDFGKKYHYEVEVCLSNNKIKFYETITNLEYGVEIWNLNMEYKNPEVDDHINFCISANERLDEEELMMIYYTYIEDGIVDDAIDRYISLEEELEKKRENMKINFNKAKESVFG